MAQSLSLARDFSPKDQAEWRSLVEKSLKGVPFEKKINRIAEDGFDIQGLYCSDDTEGLSISTRSQPWILMQEQSELGQEDAGERILDDLENGVNGLLLDGCLNRVDLSSVLSPVLLDLVTVALKPDEFFCKSAENLLTYAKTRDLSIEQIKLEINADPLTVLAMNGQLVTDLEDHFTQMSGLIEKFSDTGTNQALGVHAAAYHHAGATDGQELAVALATAVAYLRAMEARGISVEETARQLSFTFAVGSEFFNAIAKLRAARLLWDTLLTSCGVEQNLVPMKITARSADRMFTRYDPWVNMLRGTAACFAGAVGGANKITIMPYDFASDKNTNLGRRIARNVQSVLMEESSLDKVQDPASGSGFFDNLTQSLAREAWGQFQAIEASGGMAAALSDGSIQTNIQKARDKRQQKIATRRNPITGVSEFPNINEEVTVAVPSADNSQRALKPSNLAADFEAMRDQAQKLGNPLVYLATLGDLASYTPRATFAKNFFESGGIRAVDGETFEGSGASLAVICGTDEDYQLQAMDKARDLAKAGAQQIFLAGNPGDNREAFKAAGITGFIYLGLDVPAILNEVLNGLETLA